MSEKPKHEPHIEVIGLHDNTTPYMTIRQFCSCGALISERTFDARLEKDLRAMIGMGSGNADANAFIAHLEAVEDEC